MLRWLVKGDGANILQEANGYFHGPEGAAPIWSDVPTIYEPKKPREGWVRGSLVWNTTRPPVDELDWVKVREVLE